MGKSKIDGTAITGLGIGSLIAVLGYQLVKSVVREITKLRVFDNQSKTNLKKAGVDSKNLQKIKKQVNKYEKNAFVKSAFCGFINNKNFSKENLYNTVETAKIDVNSFNLIRIREVVDDKDRKNIEFLLEIPSYFDSGFNLGDYIRCIDRAFTHMWGRIVVSCKKPDKRLVGFVGYDRIDPNNPENRIAETAQVTSEFTEQYKRNPESVHDGIYDFVKHYNKMFEEAENLIEDEDEEIYIEPTEDLLDFLGFSEEDDVRIFEVFMAYKISFPRKFWNPKDKQYQGIDVAKTLECLKYLFNNLKIYKREDEDNAIKQKLTFDSISNYLTFEKVMFQSLDNNEECSLNYYYTVDPKTQEVKTLFYRYDIVE
jgi:hypothetical protein